MQGRGKPCQQDEPEPGEARAPVCLAILGALSETRRVRGAAVPEADSQRGCPAGVPNARRWAVSGGASDRLSEGAGRGSEL